MTEYVVINCTLTYEETQAFREAWERAHTGFKTTEKDITMTATNNPNPNPPQQPAPQPGTAPSTNPNPAPNPSPKG